MPVLARASIATLLAAAAHAGNPPPTCFDPVAPCASGAPGGTEQHVDAFGTSAGACATCTSDPTAPGGTGCVFPAWSSTSATPAPRLAIPKFVSPAPGVQLDEVRLVVRGVQCGVIRVEHKDPSSGCTRTMRLASEFQLDAVAGQGLDALGPVAFFETGREAVVTHAPFDGVIDFAGPSGHTEVFAEAFEERCVRITDPALVAAFVRDGVGPDTLLFDHAARDASSITSCGIVTFKADGFARIELEVTYHTCASSTSTFCFGTTASCPCANGGAPDAGCDNAQGSGGVAIAATGTPSLNDVVVVATGFPVGSAPAALLVRNVGPVQAAAPFGDGITCLPAAASSFAGAALAAGGAASIPIQHGGAGTLYYELRYRSRPAAFCDAGAAFGTSNALSVHWP